MGIRIRLGLAAGMVVAALIGLYFSPDAIAFQRGNRLEESFKGVTTSGRIVPGLFSIRSTGVSTEPVRQATLVFLDALTAEQREETVFPIDDLEWRMWNNVHRAPRQGVSFLEMTERQREKAFGMMKAGLSTKGLEKSQSVMQLNGHLADLLSKHDEYGEFRYWITVMGEPSASQPWGWQLDGHHLVINYFVLGDQVVMTPSFMGSEPVIAESGRFRGVSVLQDEQNKGLALMSSLSEAQQRKAIIPGQEKTRGNALAQAFRDNVVIDYAGIPASKFNPEQRSLLLAVVEEYVGNMAEGHARIRMHEVRDHLDSTTFAWLGGVGLDAVFYYRIQSPVILIEFDHQGPLALDGPRVPSRRHVHSVVRTPNGNDYGKDLLRQHYEQHRSDPGHGHFQE